MISSSETLSILNGISFPLMLVDLSEIEAPIRFVNQAFENDFGFSQSMLQTLKDWSDLFFSGKLYREVVVGTLLRDAENASPNQRNLPIREIEILAKRNQRLRYFLTGSVINHSLVCIFISSEGFFEYGHDTVIRKVINNISVGIFSLKTDSNKGIESFDYVNPRFVEITGCNQEKSATDPSCIAACIHPEDYPRWQAAVREAIEKEDVFSIEIRLIVDDIVRWIGTEATPRKTGSGGLIWDGFLRDITKDKRREKSLVAARDSARSDAIRQRAMVARTSHEIRTALTVILGLADLLEGGRNHFPEVETIRQLREAGHLLLAIVDDVLVASAGGSKHPATNNVPFFVQDLLDHLNGFDAVVAGSDVRLVRQSPGDRMPMLVGDARRIQQVLWNLVGNAIKYTRQGTVTVCVRVIEQTVDAVRLRLSVTDTGEGLDPQDLATVFDPFVRGSQADPLPGSGLGLTICRELVAGMGGVIGVESARGEGSTFWFELPLGIAEAGTEREDSAPESGYPSQRGAEPSGGKPLAGRRILVVDDSRSIRQLIRAFLEDAGAVVEVAGDGAVALQILASGGQIIDCVVMDVEMPVLDGIATIRRIRSQPELARMPVLAITAGLLPEQTLLARRSGMDDVIAKPIIPSRMVGQIVHAIAHRPDDGEVMEAACNPIPAVAGLDLDHVNRTMEGRRELFDMLAGVFVEEYAGFESAFREQLMLADHPGGRAEALRLLHALSGAAAQLGAFPVKAAADALHDVLRAGSDDWQAGLRHLMDALVPLVAGLRDHLASVR